MLQDKWDLEVQLKSQYSSLNIRNEEQAVLHIKENPKSFLSYARNRQKTRARIGPFVDLATGQPNPSPDFAAQLLSDQYISVFVKPRPEWLVNNVDDFFNTENQGPALSDINFSELDIEVACQELKSSSAPGADGLPAAFLKTCRKELRKPIFVLWRSSLDHGLIPPDLLLVLVCPVHKGGSRGSAKKV